jgi:hypothetical protein
MSADIINFGPHKAKQLVDEYRNSGKVSLSKLHLEDAKKFNDFLEYLNKESDHKYEQEFVEIYRKYSPLYNVNQENIDHIKKEFTELLQNLSYKNVHISDEIYMIGGNQIESMLLSLSKYRSYNGSINIAVLPDYEARVFQLLIENQKAILTAVKEDSDAIINFLQKYEGDIRKLPTGQIFNSYVMNFRDAILDIAKMVTEFCQ